MYRVIGVTIQFRQVKQMLNFESYKYWQVVASRVFAKKDLLKKVHSSVHVLEMLT